MLNNNIGRIVLAVTTFAVVVAGLPQILTSACHAQNGEDIARGLLKALIESQLQKSQRRSGGPGETLRPPNGRGVPGQPQLTGQIQQLRPIAASYSQEMATLAALLQTDSRRNVEIRRALPDVIRIQASATALSQRVGSAYSHELVIDDFRNLNSEWSVLSHQLEHCTAVSQQAKSCMQRISALDAQYCAVLGIQEQFNNQELTRAAYTLTTYVHDIADEVNNRLQPGDNSRQLSRDLGQHSQRVEYFAALVSRGGAYSNVVSEYRTIYSEWTRIEGQLGGYSGIGISRSIRRIQDTNRSIHQLLRLELGVDRNQVLNLVHSVDQDMRALCQRLTLKHMILLPDGSALPGTADAVLGTIQNLDDVAHRGEGAQSLGEAWVYADEAWKQFLYYTKPLNDPVITTGIRGISASMSSLKQTLGVTVEYDQELLVSLASTLESHAVHLQTVVNRWQSRPGTHDPTLPRQIQSLINTLHGLEQSLISNRRTTSQRQQSDQAVLIWQQLRPALKACDTEERGELEHIVSTLTPDLVRLSTMLAD